MFASLALIAVGALLLLRNLGILRLDNLTELFHVWWPVLLIVLGISMFLGRRRSGTGGK